MHPLSEDASHWIPMIVHDDHGYPILHDNWYAHDAGINAFFSIRMKQKSYPIWIKRLSDLECYDFI